MCSIIKAIIIIICLASLFTDGLAHSSYLRACSIVGVRAQNSHCQLLLTPMHLTSADCCHLRPRPTCPLDRVLFPHEGARAPTHAHQRALHKAAGMMYLAQFFRVEEAKYVPCPHTADGVRERPVLLSAPALSYPPQCS